jgi:predicted DNA-binding antitoxin AbrB/MazE fold protein
MIQEVDAIYDQGTLRPLSPLSLAEGARVHLRIEDRNGTNQADDKNKPPIGRILSPRLANPAQVADFKMEVIEATDAKL